MRVALTIVSSDPIDAPQRGSKIFTETVCPLCNHRVEGHLAIALLGNHDLTSLRAYTSPFTLEPPRSLDPSTLDSNPPNFNLPKYSFPSLEGQEDRPLTYIHFRGDLSNPTDSRPEAILLHELCFALFQVKLEQLQPAGLAPTFDQALHRLWTHAAWKTPWSYAPPLDFLPSPVDRADKPAPRGLVAQFAWTLAERLPQEVLDMVKGYSEGAWIWRVPRILEVVEGILAERDEPMVTLSLRRVSFWERGGRLEKVEKRESKLIEDEFVRLTVDANGLKRVERFPHRPSWIDESPQDEAFALVREQDLLGEVFAELKNGRMRLRFTNHREPIYGGSFILWNTPVPPRWEFLCTSTHFGSFHSNNYYCPWTPLPQIIDRIPLHDIRGLTFFIDQPVANIVGVHIHRDTDSTAGETLHQFPPWQQDRLVWVHIPVSPNDRIIGLGDQQSTVLDRQIEYPNNLGPRKLLFRLQLAGDVTIGALLGERHQPPNRRNTCSVAAGAPITMLFGKPIPGYDLLFFGAIHQDVVDQWDGYNFGGDWPGSRWFNQVLWDDDYDLHDEGQNPVGDCLSWAWLSDVAAAWVYLSPQDKRICRGILIEYGNGAQRALGQCRVNHDPCERYDAPRVMFYRPWTNDRGVPMCEVFFAQTTDFSELPPEIHDRIQTGQQDEWKKTDVAPHRVPGKDLVAMLVNGEGKCVIRLNRRTYSWDSYRRRERFHREPEME